MMSEHLLVPEPTQDTPGLASSSMLPQPSAAFLERKREEDRVRSAQRIFKFWRKARLLKNLAELARLSYSIKVQAVIRGFLTRRRIKPFIAERLRLLVVAKYAHQRGVRLDVVPLHHRRNLAARRIQNAWRSRVARMHVASRKIEASAVSILKAFRSYRFRQFTAKADVRAELRAKMKNAVTKIQAIARGMLTRIWFKANKPQLEAAVSDKRPQQLRRQRLAILEKEVQAAKLEVEANEIRRVDSELLKRILDLSLSPNKAVLEASVVRGSGVVRSDVKSVASRPSQKLKLVEVSSHDSLFVDEPQVLLPGPLAKVTQRPQLARAVAPSTMRRKAAEDAAAAKIIRQLRRDHADESATMQYALRRYVEVPSSSSAAQR